MRTNGNTREYKPTITGTITLNDNTTIALTDNDFLANSLGIRTSTSCGDTFAPGGCCIGDIDFTLLNDTGRFSNINWYDSTIELTLTANNVDVAIGKHWIVNHKEIGRLIHVECHDIMKVLDQFTLSDITLTFPCTISDALTRIRTQSIAGLNNQSLNTAYGLTFDTTAISSLLSMQLTDPGDSTPLRAFLSYVAQICGKFVRAHGTELKFDWYDMSSTYDAGTTFSHELKTNNLIYKSVTVIAPDGSKAFSRVGSNASGATYELAYTDNPLITADNMSAVSSNIASAFNGISYRPGMAVIVADIALEAGDVITLATGQEQGIKLLLMSVTYKPQLTETVVADGSGYDGDMRKISSSYARQVAQDAVNDALAGATAGMKLIHVESKSLTHVWNASSYNSRFWTLMEDGTILQWHPSGTYSYMLYEQDVEVPSFEMVQSYATSRGVNYNTIYFPIRLLIHIAGNKGYIDLWARWSSKHFIYFFNAGVAPSDPYRYENKGDTLLPALSGVPGYGTFAKCINWTDPFPFTYLSRTNSDTWKPYGNNSTNPSSIADPLDVAGELAELQSSSEFQEILVKPKVANYAFSGEEVDCIRVGTYTSSGSAGTGVISTLKLTSYTNKQMTITVRQCMIRVPTPQSIVNSCIENWDSFFVGQTPPALPSDYSDVYQFVSNPATNHNLTFDVEIPVDVLGYSTAVDSGTSVSCWLKYKGYYDQDGVTIKLVPVAYFQHCDLGSITELAMLYMRPIQFDSSRSDFTVDLIKNTDGTYYVDDGN